jgi:hypothetical protein
MVLNTVITRMGEFTVLNLMLSKCISYGHKNVNNLNVSLKNLLGFECKKSAIVAWHA